MQRGLWNGRAHAWPRAAWLRQRSHLVRDRGGVAPEVHSSRQRLRKAPAASGRQHVAARCRRWLRGGGLNRVGLCQVLRRERLWPGDGRRRVDDILLGVGHGGKFVEGEKGVATLAVELVDEGLRIR